MRTEKLARTARSRARTMMTMTTPLTPKTRSQADLQNEALTPSLLFSQSAAAMLNEVSEEQHKRFEPDRKFCCSLQHCFLLAFLCPFSQLQSLKGLWRSSPFFGVLVSSLRRFRLLRMSLDRKTLYRSHRVTQFGACSPSV